MICFEDHWSSARGRSLWLSVICSSRVADSIVCLKSSSHCSIRDLLVFKKEKAAEAQSHREEELKKNNQPDANHSFTFFWNFSVSLWLIFDLHTLVAGNDTSDFINCAARFEMRRYLRGVRPVTHNNHPHAHVERAKHFRLADVSDSLHQLENRQHRPRTSHDFNSSSLGQNARDVLEQAASRNMCQSFY